MRSLSAENVAALNERRLVPRDFIWFVAKAWATGAPFSYGFWSGLTNISAPVLNPDTGLSSTRNFEAAGGLISISDIPLVAKIETQTISVSLSQIDDAANNLIRGYDLKQARVEIYRGLFSPATRQLVAPAFCRFAGFVDDPDIETPVAGDTGAITLSCVSHTQEMTRSNTDTRSHESQLLRGATDDFYKDTTTVGEWEIFWGQKNGKIKDG